MTLEAAPPAAWHTDDWFTSPWNFEEDLQGGLAFPDTIEIHDVTLRDGEQQAGVAFSADDKIRIADLLAEAGVHRIEAGLPAVSREDAKAVAAIAARGLPSTVYAFSRCTVEDVKQAVDCGVAGVVMEIPSSRHLVEIGYRWSLERAVELSIEATRYAHDQGLLVSFFPIDATRAAAQDYVKLIDEVATHGHMDGLGLVDTFGVLTPHAVPRFVERSRERHDVPLETHFHMDFGMGVANSIIAAAHGARVIQTTVAGIGERAGNTPLEETAVALTTLYGLDLGMDLSQLTPLARLVMELSGVAQPSNRPVTGERLFSVESGIIATWLRNAREVDTTEVFPYLPSLVGQPDPDIVLGKGSGMDSIVDALERIGREDIGDEQWRLELLQRVKDTALRTRQLVSLDEFAAMVDEVTTSA